MNIENTHHTPPCVLTIAGSDSGGGAGIQADIKTMTVLGAFATSVITALTAQNGLGVTGIHAVPPDFVVEQLITVTNGFPVAAAKTGMLFSAAIIEAIAPVLGKLDFFLVVDPVCVSQSGHKLLQDDAVAALRRHMLPRADLLTPNRPEAELLAGMPIQSVTDVGKAAQKLMDMGSRAVLIKGGHMDVHESNAPDMLTDWLCVPGQKPLPLSHNRVDTNNNHGTGCTLSAAIATFIAHGHTMAQAVAMAQSYLNHCLRAAYAAGKGCGAPNHAAPFLAPSA